MWNLTGSFDKHKATVQGFDERFKIKTDSSQMAHYIMVHNMYLYL